MLPKVVVKVAQVEVTAGISGVGPGTEFIRLACLFRVTSNYGVVAGFNGKLFPFGHALTQFIGFLRVLYRKAAFTQVRVICGQNAIGQREIRVEGDGPLKRGNRSREVAAVQ